MQNWSTSQVVEFLSSNGFDKTFITHAEKCKVDGKNIKNIIIDAVSKLVAPFDGKDPEIPSNCLLVTDDKYDEDITKTITNVTAQVKQLVDKLKVNQLELSKKSSDRSKLYLDWNSLINDQKLKECFANQCNNNSFGTGMIQGIDMMFQKYFKSPDFAWNQLRAIIARNDPTNKSDPVFSMIQGCLVVSYSFSAHHGWPLIAEKTMNCLMTTLTLPDEDLGHGITLVHKFKFDPLKRNDCDALINHSNNLLKILKEKAGINVMIQYDMESLLSADKPSELINRVATAGPIWTDNIKNGLERFVKQYYGDNWKSMGEKLGWTRISISHDESIKNGVEISYQDGNLTMKWSMRAFGFPGTVDKVFDDFSKVFPTKAVDLGNGLNTDHLKKFSAPVQDNLTKMLKQKLEDANKHLMTNLGFTLEFSFDFDSILSQTDFDKIAQYLVASEPFPPKVIVEAVIHGIKGDGGHWYWSQNKNYVQENLKGAHFSYDPNGRSQSLKDKKITFCYKMTPQGSPLLADGWMGVIDSLIGVPKDMKIWGGLEEKHYSQLSWTSRKMVMNTLKPRVEACLKLARDMKVEKRTSVGQPIPVVKVSKIKYTDLPSGIHNSKLIAERIKKLKNVFWLNTKGVESIDDRNAGAGELQVLYKDQQHANDACALFKDKNQLEKFSSGQAPDFMKYSFEIVKKEVHLANIEKTSDAVGLELTLTFDWESLLKDANVDRVLEFFSTYERDDPTERVTYGWKMMIDCALEIYAHNYSKLTPKDFYAGFCDKFHFIHDPSKGNTNIWSPLPADMKKEGSTIIISYFWGGAGFCHLSSETMRLLKKLVKVPTIDPGFTNPKGFLKYSGLTLDLLGQFSEKAQGFIVKPMLERVQKTLLHLKERTGLEIEMSIDWNSIIQDKDSSDKICEHWATFRRDGYNYAYRAFSHAIRSIYETYFPKGSTFPVKSVHFVNKTGGAPSFTPDAPEITLKGDQLICTYHMIGWGFAITDWETCMEVLKLISIPKIDKGFGLATDVMATYQSAKSGEHFDLFIKRMKKMHESVPDTSIYFDFATFAKDPLKEKCIENIALLDWTTLQFLHAALKEMAPEKRPKNIVLGHVIDGKMDHVQLSSKDGAVHIDLNWLNPSCVWSKNQFIENLCKI